jgi:putative drug exporter of the RND superfamily
MRKWLVVAAWLIAALAGATFGAQIFDRAASVSELGPGAESMRAAARLKQLVPEGPIVIAVVKGREPYDPELVASVRAVADSLNGVAKVETLYNTPGGQIGRDGRTTMVRAEPLDPSKQDEVVAALRKIAAPEVLIGGESLAKREFADRAVRDAAFGEGIALVVLAGVLVLIFRRVRPVLIVLGAALTTVCVTLLVLRVLSEFVSVSEFALNVVSLLGLGLTVDYALLLLTWEKAHRAVLISGAAVTLALAGLLVFAEPLLRSMALGGFVASIVATGVALTWVPIWKRAQIATKANLVGRLARFATAHAAPTAVLTGGLLVLLALPFLSVRLGNSGASSLPKQSESRRVAEEIRQNFEFGRAEPVTVIVEGDASGAGMRDYLNALNKRELGVARLQLRLDIPQGTTVIDLTPVSDARGPDVVRAVRAQPFDHPALVGGPAAEIVDYRDAVAQALPLMLAVLFAALLLLLFALTGSLVIPVKALILNLLTLGASLGMLALAFGELDLTTPVLLFVFIFGLTMDYEVFLLARITDEYRAGAGNDRAVLVGLTKTGPVVTAAAACLIVVFLGFVFGQLAPVREIGVGMTIALALDVTIVRGLLLPATMKLLGRYNWWPGRLPQVAQAT